MQYPQIRPEYIQYAIRFGKIAFIILLGLSGIHILRKIIKKHLLKLYPDALRVNVIVRLISYFLFFLVATIALQEIGIDMTALIGAAGVVGVAIGFAAQTSVANIISGLFLTLEHPFELNDTIIINTIEGQIKAVNLFAVTIRTSDNKIVRIPNEQVLKSNIYNITKNKNRRFESNINLAPEASIQQAIGVIKELATQKDYLLNELAPFIAIKEVAGNYSRLFIGVWTTQKNWETTRAHFLSDLKMALAKNDIQLAISPIICKS
ncbi:MAG: mechanosensitive ion channel family protein [Candidatus Dependentiae bacterium]